MEVDTGFEPVYTALQAAASPLGQSTTKWKVTTGEPVEKHTHSSGGRDSNSRPSPWQGDALPLRHIRMCDFHRTPEL